MDVWLVSLHVRRRAGGQGGTDGGRLWEWKSRSDIGNGNLETALGMEVAKRHWEWKSRNGIGNGSREATAGMEVAKRLWEWKY